MGILRLLLAICVIVEHAGPALGWRPLSGVAAVQTFFIISGFYMALILQEKYRGPGSYRLFISNRFLRIYPIYWLTLLLVVAGWGISCLRGGPSGPLGVYRTLNAPGSAFISTANAIIFGQDATLFTAHDGHGHLVFTDNFAASAPQINTFLFIPQAWTLSLELMFYLLAPLIVRQPTRSLMVLMAGSLILRGYIYFWPRPPDDPWMYRFFPTELCFFVAGVLSYRVYGRIRSWPWARTLGLLGGAGLMAYALVYDFLPVWHPQGIFIREWVFYLLAWGVVPFLFVCSRTTRLDRDIGELSYPIYITHWMVIVGLGALLGPMLGSAGLTPAAIAVTIAVSLVMTRWVSLPLERLRQGRADRLAKEMA